MLKYTFSYEIYSLQLQISELMRHVENISLHITLVENNWKTYNIKIKDCQGLSHNTESNVSYLIRSLIQFRFLIHNVYTILINIC